MRDKPLPAVKALIQQNGKLLVLKTMAAEKTYYVLPGGKIEYGEEPLEALQRELEEEISCEAKIGEPVGMYDFFTGSKSDSNQVVLTVFKADIDDQEVDISNNPADEGIDEALWMKPEEFLEASENESLKDLIRQSF